METRGRYVIEGVRFPLKRKPLEEKGGEERNRGIKKKTVA